MADSDTKMILSVNEKHKQVRQWLECKFAGKPIPSYEVNQRTIEELHHLMRLNEERDRDTELIIEDLRQAAAEYTAEAEREGKILEQVGFSPSTLSQSGATNLRTLVNLADELKLRDTADTYYLLGLGELSRELFQVAEQRREERESARQLQSKTRAVTAVCCELKQSLELLDKQAVSCQQKTKANIKSRNFLEKKAKEYNSTVRKLKAQLDTKGMEPSLIHSQLVRRAEEIQAIEKKIHPLKVKLKTFQDLPPDVSLAKDKVAELQRELDVLEKEVTKGLHD